MELSLYAKVYFLNHIKNIIMMFIVVIFVATIDEPMPGAVGVELVKETPRIIGRDAVHVEFVTVGTTDKCFVN